MRFISSALASASGAMRLPSPSSSKQCAPFFVLAHTVRPPLCATMRVVATRPSSSQVAAFSFAPNSTGLPSALDPQPNGVRSQRQKESPISLT